MTCGDCKHWDKAEKGPIYYEQGHDWTTPEPRMDGEWGTCGEIIREACGAYDELPRLDEGPIDVPAYLSDGSGYFASLTTRSDFGCALFEAKP